MGQVALAGFPSYADVLHLSFAVMPAIAVVGPVRACRPGKDLPGPLAVASLMAPAAPAIEWLRGMPIGVPVIVIGCAVLLLPVIADLDAEPRRAGTAMYAAKASSATDSTATPNR